MPFLLYGIDQCGQYNRVRKVSLGGKNGPLVQHMLQVCPDGGGWHLGEDGGRKTRRIRPAVLRDVLIVQHPLGSRRLRGAQGGDARAWRGRSGAERRGLRLLGGVRVQAGLRRRSLPASPEPYCAGKPAAARKRRRALSDRGGRLVPNPGGGSRSRATLEAPVRAWFGWPTANTRRAECV